MTQFIYSSEKKIWQSSRYIFWTSPKAIMNPEQLEPSSSPASVLALSNIEEDMGHNTERAQELQEELAQWRAHYTGTWQKVKPFRARKLCWPISLKRRSLIRLRSQSCFTYICSRPKKSSSNVMRLSTCPLCLKNSRLSWRKSKNSTAHIEELQREAFNILPGMVNARWDAALAHASGILQDIPVTSRSHFENELEEEATWASHSHPHHVHFASDPRGDLHLPPENILRSRDLLPVLMVANDTAILT